MTECPKLAQSRLLRSANLSRGFSTIELLMVIAILIVLAAISGVVIKVVDQSKTNSARVTLESLQSALVAAEKAGIFRTQPAGVWVFDGSVGAPSPQAKWRDKTYKDLTSKRRPDIWRQPDPAVESDPFGGNIAIPTYSPGLVTQDSILGENTRTDWRTHPAIRNTAAVIARIQSVPAAQKLLEALPDNVAQLPIPWTPRSSDYAIGTRVIYMSNLSPPNDGLLVYTAIGTPNAQDTVACRPTPTGISNAWKLDYAGILDTFGRPILYVPSGGIQVGDLHVLGKPYKKGDRAYLISGSRRVYYVCVASTKTTPASSPGVTDAWQFAEPIRSPDGKPFWASAGPDGNFNTALDNIYSFPND